MAIREPFIEQKVIDYTALSSQVNFYLETGMVINSDKGPVGKRRLSSITQLINEYLAGSSITAESDITVKSAAKILQFSPVWVTRAFDNTVFAGLSDKGNAIFVNDSSQIFRKSTRYKLNLLKENQISYLTFAYEYKTNGTTHIDYYVFHTYIESQSDKTAFESEITELISPDPSTSAIYFLTYQEWTKSSDDSVEELVYHLNDILTDDKTINPQHGMSDFLSLIINGSIEITCGENVSLMKEYSSPEIQSIIANINTGTFKKYVYQNIVGSNQIKITSPSYYSINGNTFLFRTENTNIIYPGNLVMGSNNYDYYPTRNKTYSKSDVNNPYVTLPTHRLMTYMYDYLVQNDQKTPCGLDNNYILRLTNKIKKIRVSGPNYKLLDRSIEFGIAENEGSSESPNWTYKSLIGGQTSYGTRVEDVDYDGNITGYTYTFNDDAIPVIFMDPNLEYISGCSISFYYVDSVIDNYTQYNYIEFATDDYIPEYNENRVLLVNLKSHTLFKIILDIYDYFDNSLCYTRYLTVNASNNVYKLIDQEGNLVTTEVGDTITLVNIKQRLAASLDPIDIIRFYLVGNDDENTAGLETKENVVMIFNSLDLTNYQTSRLIAAITTTSNDDTSINKYTLSGSDINDSSVIYNDIYFKIYTRTNGNVDSNNEVIYDNKYVFYIGNYDQTDVDEQLVRLSTTGLTKVQFIRRLRKAVGNIFNITNTSDGFTLFDLAPELIHEVYTNTTKLVVSEASTSYDTAIENGSFAVINRGPAKSKLYKFTIERDEDDPEIYHFTFYNGAEELEYDISFVDDKVDTYGRNIYYNYINDINSNIFFDMIRLNSDKVPGNEYESRLFGDEVPVEEPESDDYVEAFQRYRDFNGTYYSFFFDGGVANTVVANAVCNLGIDLFAEALITLPDIKDPAQLMAYRTAIGIDHWEGRLAVPRLTDTTIGDFVTYISPNLCYLEKVIRLAKEGAEFAPVFGTTNGVMALPPKFKYTDKEQRELMLNSQINTVIWDDAKQIAYDNLDLTMQHQDTTLSNCNNVRIINACAHICDEYLMGFIGLFNDEKTRLEVVNGLTDRINTRVITNQKFAPLYLRVVCDESNNPVSVQQNRQLVVDLYYQLRDGIREIRIYHKIFKLSQDMDLIQ